MDEDGGGRRHAALAARDDGRVDEQRRSRSRSRAPRRRGRRDPSADGSSARRSGAAHRAGQVELGRHLPTPVAGRIPTCASAVRHGQGRTRVRRLRSGAPRPVRHGTMMSSDRVQHPRCRLAAGPRGVRAVRASGRRCGSCARPAVRCRNTARCAPTTRCWTPAVTPALVTEITLQPVRRHGVDAAILFSDIVVPLVAVGVGVDIVAGVGPVVEHPVRALGRPGRAAPARSRRTSRTSRDAVRSLVAELGRHAADRLRGRAVHAGELSGRGRAVARTTPAPRR